MSLIEILTEVLFKKACISQENATYKKLHVSDKTKSKEKTGFFGGLWWWLKLLTNQILL